MNQTSATIDAASTAPLTRTATRADVLTAGLRLGSNAEAAGDGAAGEAVMGVICVCALAISEGRHAATHTASARATVADVLTAEIAL